MIPFAWFNTHKEMQTNGTDNKLQFMFTMYWVILLPISHLNTYLFQKFHKIHSNHVRGVIPLAEQQTVKLRHI